MYKIKRFIKLLKSILEIENLFNNKELDIEFIVDKKKINILQVRPIVSQNTLKNDYTLLNKCIKKLQFNLKNITLMKIM